MEVTPIDSLRAKQVKIPLHDASGNEVQVAIAFDNNVLADIEEQYGSIAGWQTAINTKPFQTVRDTLAIVLAEDDKRSVGARMIQGKMQAYVGAIGVSLALANGADPTEAVAVMDAIAAGSTASAAMIAAGMAVAVPTKNDDELSVEPSSTD